MTEIELRTEIFRYKRLLHDLICPALDELEEELAMEDTMPLE